MLCRYFSASGTVHPWLTSPCYLISTEVLSMCLLSTLAAFLPPQMCKGGRGLKCCLPLSNLQHIRVEVLPLPELKKRKESEKYPPSSQQPQKRKELREVTTKSFLATRREEDFCDDTSQCIVHVNNYLNVAISRLYIMCHII